MSGIRRAERSRVVKPRWVWGGLVLAVAGASLIGLGMTVEPRTWIRLVGAAVLTVGAAVAARGGILRDAYRGSPAKAELDHVVRGTDRAGIVPGEMVHDPAAQRTVQAAAETTRALEAERHAAATPPWSLAAGWVLLLVTIALVVSQWELVAHDTTGRANSYRDTGLAILIGLAGLRFVVSSGRHWVVGIIAIAAGAGLILGGWLAEHHNAGLVVVEVVCGTLTIGAVIVALTGRRSVRPSAPDTVGARTRAMSPGEPVAEGATTYSRSRRK